MLSIFTAITAVFDMYCLSMAVPGSIHQGFYFFSYDFVYIGNKYGKVTFYKCVEGSFNNVITMIHKMRPFLLANSKTKKF